MISVINSFSSSLLGSLTCWNAAVPVLWKLSSLWLSLIVNISTPFEKQRIWGNPSVSERLMSVVLLRNEGVFHGFDCLVRALRQMHFHDRDYICMLSGKDFELRGHIGKEIMQNSACFLDFLTEFIDAVPHLDHGWSEILKWTFHTRNRLYSRVVWVVPHFGLLEKWFKMKISTFGAFRCRWPDRALPLIK